jgi:hypothetical protein
MAHCHVRNSLQIVNGACMRPMKLHILFQAAVPMGGNKVASALGPRNDQDCWN